MMVTFAGRDMEVKELIARCLAENYLQFGFADDGEADKVAARIMTVLDDLGCKVVPKKLPRDAWRSAKEAMPVEIRYWLEDGMLRAEFLKPSECVDPQSVWDAAIAKL